MRKICHHTIAALVATPMLVLPGLSLGEQPTPVLQSQSKTVSEAEEYRRLNRIGIDLKRIGVENKPRGVPKRAAGSVMNLEIAKKKLAQAAAERDLNIRSQFCDQVPTDRLCSQLPKDNTDFSNRFVYSFILAKAQDSFDIFSWQSFVSMNWPVTASAEEETVIGDAPQAARKWFSYKTPQQLFAPDYTDPICADTTEDELIQLRLSSFRQTGGLPLIDRNLNYVLYDIRINDVLADYIVDNGLDSIEGQQAFADAGNEVDFPLGFYDDSDARSGGGEGAAAMKSAWKILDESRGDDPSRFFQVNAAVSVTPDNSETGETMCLRVKLGLVGMHIMTRTKTGNGSEWTWSTFEHVDNAPVAVNSRKPIDTLHKNLFDGGCKGPTETDREYAFYDAACKDCNSNSIKPADWKWAATAPYAATHAQHGKYGTQVVRCWRVFEGTQDVNAIWQQKLRGTVWANYQSSSAQWKGANRGAMFPQGEVPRFLINTTMETYDQYSERSSCLSCHADARTVAGKDSNFSFILSLATRYQGLVSDRNVAQRGDVQQRN